MSLLRWELGEDVGDVEVVDGTEAEGGGDAILAREDDGEVGAGVDGPALRAVFVAGIDGERDVVEVDRRLRASEVFLAFLDIVGEPDGDGRNVRAVFAQLLIEDFQKAANRAVEHVGLNEEERRGLAGVFGSKVEFCRHCRR